MLTLLRYLEITNFRYFCLLRLCFIDCLHILIEFLLCAFLGVFLFCFVFVWRGGGGSLIYCALCFWFFLIIAIFCPVLKGSDEAGPLYAGFQTELFHGRHPLFGYSSIRRELPLLHGETR